MKEIYLTFSPKEYEQYIERLIRAGCKQKTAADRGADKLLKKIREDKSK